MAVKRNMWIAVAAVIAIMGAIAYVAMNGACRLTYVVDTLPTEDGLYLVDDDNKTISIYKVDGKGAVEKKIDFPKLQGEQFVVPDYLSCDGDQVYIYLRKHNALSNLVESEAVYRCNFGSRKVEKVWDLAYLHGGANEKGEYNQEAEYRIFSGEDQNFLSPQVRNGVLYYFRVSEQVLGGAAHRVARLFSIGAEPDVVYDDDFDPTRPVLRESVAIESFGYSITDCFYTDLQQVVLTTSRGDLYVTGTRTALPGGALPYQPGEGETEGEAMGIIGGIPAIEVIAGLYNDGRTEATEEAAEEPEALAEGEELLNVEQAGGAMVRSLPDDHTVPTLLADIRVADFAHDRAHTLYIADESYRKIIRIDLTTFKRDYYDIDRIGDIRYESLQKVRYRQDGSFTAAVPRDENTNMLGDFEAAGSGKYKSSTSLRYSGGYQFSRGVVVFLICLAGIGVLYLLWQLFRRLSHGRIPIVTKMVVAFVPVVAVSLILLGTAMETLFSEVLHEEQYDRLLLVCENTMQGINFEKFRELDLENPSDDTYYFDLKAMLASLKENDTRLPVKVDGGTKSVYNYAYYWLFRVEQGAREEDIVLRSVLCEDTYVGRPIEYYYADTTIQKYKQAIRDKEVIQTTFRDVEGKWIAVIIPVVDPATGKVVAVLETGTTSTSLDYRANQKIRQINTINGGILALLLLLLSAIIAYSLNPLKRLRECVVEVTKGHLGVTTAVKGNDEVAEIATAFNQMSRSVAESVSELREYNAAYHKFVPREMFKVLERSRIVDVRLGDQTHTEVAVLSVSPVDFEGIVSRLSGREMFGFINRLLSTIVPVVIEYGGVIDKFADGGCIAFFTEGPGEALASCVSALQKIDLENRRDAFGIDRPVRMASAISYGSVMIGIVGHEARLEATNISEHTNLVGFLKRVAPKYQACILTTAPALERVPDYTEDYHVRVLGYLRIRSTGEVMRLYDVFDGDPDDMRFLKRQTRELFEQGVALYRARAFYEARLVFIKVLKQFRQDTAAQEYLYLCDRYYQLDDTGQIDTCIEFY